MSPNGVSENVDGQVLTEIGVALFQLRRIWAKPDLMRKLREHAHSDRPLQMSNLAVVHAIAKLTRESHDQVTVGGVAERIDVDPSTASRLVGHAIDAGLVCRRPSPVDARRANLQLTDLGVRVVEAADQGRRSYLAQLMSDWTVEECNEFARLLTRFTETAMKHPMDPSSIDQIFKAAEAEPARPGEE